MGIISALLLATGPFGGVWSSSDAFPSARIFHASFGTVASTLLASGDDSSSARAEAWSCSGGAWSAIASMATARIGAGGVGTAASAYVQGGYDGGTVYGTGETFNGTAWSSSTGLPEERYFLCECGTPSSALMTSGTDVAFASLGTSYTYNGTAWSAAASDSGNLGYGATMTGTVSSAIAALGYALLFNGTAWSSGATTVEADRQLNAAIGTPTDCLIMGGRDSSYANYWDSTEKYNGTSWASAATMVYGNDSTLGAARSTATGMAHMMTGNAVSGLISTTQRLV